MPTILAATQNASVNVADTPMAQVVIMGIVIVFVMLVCIIILCKVMSAITNAFKKEAPKPVAATPVQTPVQAPTANSQQIIAAVGVAIAEHMGTDVSRIKIHSIKKI